MITCSLVKPVSVCQFIVCNTPSNVCDAVCNICHVSVRKNRYPATHVFPKTVSVKTNNLMFFTY